MLKVIKWGIMEAGIQNSRKFEPLQAIAIFCRLISWSICCLNNFLKLSFLSDFLPYSQTAWRRTGITITTDNETTTRHQNAKI